MLQETAPGQSVVPKLPFQDAALFMRHRREGEAMRDAVANLFRGGL